MLSHVWLLVTPWTAASQASLSFTISWSFLKLMSIELVMPSNHLICCHVCLCPNLLKTPVILDSDYRNHLILKMLASWRKSYDKPRQHIKKQRHYLADKDPNSQIYGFSSSHVWMWELNYKECWALKNWCFWTVVLEKTLESPLDYKEIQPVHPKGNQSWIFIGRTDAEAEAPILWPPDAKGQFIGKDLDVGKIEGRKRREWERLRW